MNLRLITGYFYPLSLVMSLLLVAGCDGQPTTNQVCETHPELCEG
ncbi:DUF2989 domain-containing protein [Salinivibrio socompensis]|nr:DUF2989 domain-containing protein [Salinivibrio socompensis]